MGTDAPRTRTHRGLAALTVVLIAVLVVGGAAGEAGRTVKAVELSGVPNLLFRRNSLNGQVEVLSRTGDGVALNAALHA